MAISVDSESIAITSYILKNIKIEDKEIFNKTMSIPEVLSNLANKLASIGILDTELECVEIDKSYNRVFISNCAGNVIFSVTFDLWRELGGDI